MFPAVDRQRIQKVVDPMQIHLLVLDVMYLMQEHRQIDHRQQQLSIKIHLQVQDDMFPMVIMIYRDDYYLLHKQL